MAVQGTAAQAAEVIPTIVERFTPEDVLEEPDFQKHVIPLLSRLGCNGRACHGSFQGQGGFQLSLFGYDFGTDHEALTRGDEPRGEVQGTRDVLAQLKSAGIERFALLTGDRPQAAQTVAKSLGYIDHVEAGMLPLERQRGRGLLPPPERHGWERSQVPEVSPPNAPVSSPAHTVRSPPHRCRSRRAFRRGTG
jgi:hypothetical protein